MEINNLTVAQQRANARLPRGVFKSHKFHRSLRNCFRNAGGAPGVPARPPNLTLKL